MSDAALSFYLHVDDSRLESKFAVAAEPAWIINQNMLPSRFQQYSALNSSLDASGSEASTGSLSAMGDNQQGSTILSNDSSGDVSCSSEMALVTEDPPENDPDHVRTGRSGHSMSRNMSAVRGLFQLTNSSDSSSERSSTSESSSSDDSTSSREVTYEKIPITISSPNSKTAADFGKAFAAAANNSKALTRSESSRTLQRMDVLDIPPDVIAEQLTLMDFSLYREITGDELYSCGWADQKYKHAKAPNVMNFIERFNQTAYWVSVEILERQNPEMRAKVICHLLKTCRHLKTLQNLNSEAALVSALRNAAIYRLYKTWALVPTKEKDYLSRRSEFLLEKGQFRVFLEGAAPPCVPFLGPFLTELITVEEAYRDADGSNCASVESRKRKMDDVLHGVLRFQTSNYQKLRSVEALQRYINSRKYINALFKFTEDELYKRSLTLEPQESPSRRPSNSEKITFSIGSPTKTFSRTRSVASLIIQQTSSLVAGNVAMLGNLENLVCGKEGKFPFSHRKARSLETRTNIAEDGYKRSAEMSDKPRSVSTCITPICLMGDVTRSSLSAESAHDQYDLNGEQGNPAQMGSHQRALGSVSSSVSSLMLYPGSHGSWYGSVVRRRALKKNHRKVRWAKQKDYWMELHGCRLFMFSHRLLGDKCDRNGYRSDPWKAVDVTGSKITTTSPSSFILSFPNSGNEWHFVVDSPEKTDEWVSSLRRASQTCDAPENLMEF